MDNYAPWSFLAVVDSPQLSAKPGSKQEMGNLVFKMKWWRRQEEKTETIIAQYTFKTVMTFNIRLQIRRNSGQKTLRNILIHLDHLDCVLAVRLDYFQEREEGGGILLIRNKLWVSSRVELLF